MPREPGVERWRGDCACTEGPGAWKWHLRHALAMLATRMDTLYEQAARKLLRDPGAAEEDYVWARLGAESTESFRGRHARRPHIGRHRTFKLLEARPTDI